MRSMDKLNLKETMAIELKYLGNSMKAISEKLEMPFDTVNGWFRTGGKLDEAYLKYTEEVNEKRKQQMEKKISISDDEFFILTTNIVRQIGKSLQKRKVPLVNKKGQAVADENGLPQYIEVEPSSDFSVSDLRNVWQMQRIMKGLPINYEKQEVSQTSFESDMIIKELGLTEEDFKDENIEATTNKITKHLLKR